KPHDGTTRPFPARAATTQRGRHALRNPPRRARGHRTHAGIDRRPRAHCCHSVTYRFVRTPAGTPLPPGHANHAVPVLSAFAYRPRAPAVATNRSADRRGRQRHRLSLPGAFLAVVP